MNAGRELYSMAGVPKRHKDFRPDHHNKDEQWRWNYDKLKNLLTNRGIAGVFGKRGAGKTQACASVIGFCCLNLGKSAKYVKAFDLFLSIRNGNNPSSNTTEKQEVEKYCKPFLLVIDAFEVRGDTAFENRTMDHIIDRRYDEQRPTILISNEDKSSFSASLGISTLDRLKEGGGLIEFTKTSFRGSEESFYVLQQKQRIEKEDLERGIEF